MRSTLSLRFLCRALFVSNIRLQFYKKCQNFQKFLRLTIAFPAEYKLHFNGRWGKRRWWRIEPVKDLRAFRKGDCRHLPPPR